MKGAIALIRKLQRGADKFEAEHGRRRRVFIQSMSDFFDNEVDPAWRAEAWKEIVAADRLDIQLVTKRVSNVGRMIHAAEGGAAHWPRHVGLIVTVVNQDEANRDIPRLLDLKRKARIPWVGLSIEPMLGPIDLHRIENKDFILCALSGAALLSPDMMRRMDALELMIPPRIDWVIVGGESGKDARPVEVAWVWAIRDQCATYNVPFFFKQWGAWHADAMAYTDMHGRNPPPNMKIGVKKAGRIVAGRTHDEFPRTAYAR